MKFSRILKICFLLVGILPIAGLMAPAGHAADAAYKLQHSLDFTESDLFFDKVMDYDIIRLAERGYINTVGEPMLPSRIIRVALPEGMAVTKVAVSQMQTREVDGEFNIFPAQPPAEFMFSGADPEFVPPDAKTYASSTPYPAAPVTFIRQADLAGQAFAIIKICPLRYTPAERKIELLTSIDLVIEGANGYVCGDYLPDVISHEGREEYEQRLKATTVNPENVSLRVNTLGSKLASALPSGGPFDHVIITSVSDAPYYQPLIDWHTRKGVRDTAITADYIYDNYDGADEQEKIRNFVIDAHQNWGAIYFLMGGENNTVPFEYRSYSGDNVPSDAYYADYDDDWEYEVYIGRMTAEGEAEIGRFVDKVLKYETDPPPIGFTTNVTLLGMDLTVANQPPYYIRTAGEMLKDSIDVAYLPREFAVTKVYDSHLGNHRDAFLEAINNGQNLINHCDHSNTMVMGTGDRNHGWYVSGYDVFDMTNNYRNCIIFSTGCLANRMDANDCISEYYTFYWGTVGALAFIGNTRSGWFYVGDPYGLSSDLDIHWWAALLEHDQFRLGEALAFAKSASAVEEAWPYSEWTLNLLGEPEMPVWTDLPLSFDVTHAVELEAIPSDFTVHVSGSGGSIEDAYVCLWKGSEVYEREYTDPDGNAGFNVYPTTNGPMYVTVTKHNYIPYQGEAAVVGNTPPVCIAPDDTTIMQCEPDEVSLPVGCFDYDGNLATGPVLTKGPGQIIGDSWYYTPTANDTVSVTIRCTDSLGFSCETTFIVIFNLNDAPVCVVPGDTSITQINSPSEISLPAFAEDDDGNLKEFGLVSGPGTLENGYWRYISGSDETISVTVSALDSCDESGEESFMVDYILLVCGDASNDETVNILDATWVINYLYKDGPAPYPIESADPDGSGTVNLLDATCLINYLYKDGPAPLCPN